MMLQDIYPHKINNQYSPDIQPADNDYVLAYDGQRVLARISGSLSFPRVSDCTGDIRSGLIYLFSVDSERYFLPAIASPVLGIEGFEYLDLKDVRESETPPKYRVFSVYTGKHLSDWYKSNRYCGRCGHSMVHSSKERAMTCPQCGFTSYPRIMPAVIVGVTNGDRLLITKYRTGYNHHAMVAGFTEIGETLEETVSREVMEEAGIKVKNIRYYKSQPWGIASDILAGFFCDVDGDDTIHMDNNELKYAQWVAPQDIILQPDESSLTNEMMRLFKENGYKATL